MGAVRKSSSCHKRNTYSVTQILGFGSFPHKKLPL
ncbi:hypothetical protein MelnitzEXVC044M_222 [Methylophilales phage Melnitz EXVC044M]|nr:hypothetical protein Melnitz1EXVC043M_221 [Methylophilales phage Melnitz-1 EXVC043M]QZI94726.1 hypothetical protein Melnitz2EXVC040M_222 [Methylophilales phage Melnitz-2 EXVC040M]QZI94948.1 hypothetical protein MelnitzEXVC044M_222 [Methylophilales phage Melnitz EXVC044M]QZI95169.1 hypothetical protein Melnitz3EXVC039M_222 [Methylophilales phage Melnitz-3 EXVC039M]